MYRITDAHGRRIPVHITCTPAACLELEPNQKVGCGLSGDLLHVASHDLEISYGTNHNLSWDRWPDGAQGIPIERAASQNSRFGYLRQLPAADTTITLVAPVPDSIDC
jgi:hypothetical protein